MFCPFHLDPFTESVVTRTVARKPSAAFREHGFGYLGNPRVPIIRWPPQWINSSEVVLSDCRGEIFKELCKRHCVSVSYRNPQN